MLLVRLQETSKDSAVTLSICLVGGWLDQEARLGPLQVGMSPALTAEGEGSTGGI